MLKNQSLNSIMNEMAQAQNPQHFVCEKETLEPLSELEAFTALDDTLDALHKQYMDSKAQRKELVALCGGDDAMSVVALDLEDSNWCAMQTRYIEVREDRQMMAQVQSMMRMRMNQILERKERILKRDKENQAMDFMNYLKIMEAVKKKNKTPNIFEWFAVLFFLRIDLSPQSLKKQSYHYGVAA